MSKIRLITGGIGTGKSLWTVEQLFKEHEKTPERKIYTDITGIKHTGILKAPDDWREIPNNSLIVYDEVQYRELFSRHNSKRDKQILDLTTIRKRGIELWLITQRARFLNADVLGLVNEHVHLERVGQKVSNVYIWQEAELNITKTKKMFAFEKYRWAYPEHIFGFYESIQPDAKHNKRSYLNKSIIGVVATLFIAIVAGAFYVKNVAQKGITSNGVETAHTKNNEQLEINKKVESSNITQPAKNLEGYQTNSIAEFCRHADNVDTPKCVEYYKYLSDNKLDYPAANANLHAGAKIVSYNPATPFDTQSLQESVQYQATAKPVFAGCMQLKSGKYQGYTQQGTKLDVTQADCKRLIFNDDRPFDYFANESQPVTNPVTSTGADVQPIQDQDKSEVHASQQI